MNCLIAVKFYYFIYYHTKFQIAMFSLSVCASFSIIFAQLTYALLQWCQHFFVGFLQIRFCNLLIRSFSIPPITNVILKLHTRMIF